MVQPGTCYATPIYPQIYACHLIRCTLRYCIKEFMQENTHVQRCLVPEDPAGVFHARSAAHEALVLPMDKKGKDGSSRILDNAASLFSFSISLFRSYCGVQLFLDDEDRCSGPMKTCSSLLLLQFDNFETM